jgi:periplasmic protein TonB
MNRTGPIDRAHGRPPERSSLAARKRAERHAARARIAERPVKPLSADQRAFDPLARGSVSAGRKALIAAGAVVAGALFHGGVYGFGAWLGPGKDDHRKRDIVAIEVREHQPEPEKKPPPPPTPVPEPERIIKPRIERRKVEQPPPDEPPPAPSKGPPPRVTGLNYDSTSQAGGGPAYATGNTRRGETARRAVDPKTLDRKVVDPPPSPNQTASRIPSAGAKYVLPRRKRPAKPPYPEQLLTQGIEAAVTVMVSLDATGKVTNVKIIKSAAYPEFNDAALKTAWAEAFEPATRDGTPIPYTLSYTYRFTIDDQ